MPNLGNTIYICWVVDNFEFCKQQNFEKVDRWVVRGSQKRDACTHDRSWTRYRVSINLYLKTYTFSIRNAWLSHLIVVWSIELCKSMKVHTFFWLVGLIRIIGAQNIFWQMQKWLALPACRSHRWYRTQQRGYLIVSACWYWLRHSKLIVFCCTEFRVFFFCKFFRSRPVCVCVCVCVPLLPQPMIWIFCD